MSLLFFHSHLRTHGITKSVTKAFNTGMPKLQIKRMSQHAIKHILITHKKPKRIEWTHFLVCLKFRQLAWWQSAVLSLSNVTSRHLFLHYFRFEVPSALPVLSQFKKNLPTMLWKYLGKHSQNMQNSPEYPRFSLESKKKEKEERMRICVYTYLHMYQTYYTEFHWILISQNC